MNMEQIVRSKHLQDSMKNVIEDVYARYNLNTPQGRLAAFEHIGWVGICLGMGVVTPEEMEAQYKVDREGKLRDENREAY